jgi:microcystin-dependent protein
MGIKLKRSDVAGKAPAIADLELGELAVNTSDGKLYLKKSVGGTESIVALSDVIASGSVVTAMIADGAVTALKIADGSVTVSKLGGDITAAGKALLDDASAAAQRTTLGLGTAATLNAGSSASNVVQLDGSARLPAVDGSQLTNLPAASGLPAGAVMPYAGGNAPAGWLLCFGQAVSRTAYAALFAAIGTTHGAGDGSTTFNLPDLRGRVVAGQDDMGGTSANRLTNQAGGLDGDILGAAGGAETHTLTVAQMPAHNHHDGYTNGSSSLNGLYGSTIAGSTSDMSFSGSGAAHPNTSTTGGSGAHNNVQPTIVLNYLIKT